MASAEVVFENLDLPPRFDPALVAPPAGDSILAALPASAAEKMRGFQASRDDLRAVLRAASDDLYEAQQDRHDADRRLRDLEAMPRTNPSDIAQARSIRDRATDQLSRIQDRIDARRARADHLAELVANLERWVRSLNPRHADQGARTPRAEAGKG
jgi:phage shock protein A